MLIKYKHHVVNLNQVTDFIQYGEKEIRFFFACCFNDTNTQVTSFFEFDSGKERDDAFEDILMAYQRKVTICRIGIE